MELRPLGKTGLRVSAIGLGLAKLGRNQQMKFPEPFELPSDAQARALLAEARDLGINLLDTAPAYGSSERRLGELLDDPAQWVIVTKVGEQFDGVNSRFDFSPQAVNESVRQSMARLRRQVLDVVLIHSDGNDVAVLRESGALEALRSLRDSGAIRAIGASTKTVEGGLLATEFCDVVMISFARGDEDQIRVLDAARERGVGVLLKKVLSSGHTDHPEVALERALCAPGVSSALVGTINPVHLRSNAAIAERVAARVGE